MKVSYKGTRWVLCIYNTIHLKNQNSPNALLNQQLRKQNKLKYTHFDLVSTDFFMSGAQSAPN